MNRFATKISVQLLFTIAVSFIISLAASVILAYYMIPYYILNTQSISPVIYNMIVLFIFIIGIGVFVLTFFLFIRRKIKYIKYISEQVREIANEGFGSIIEIKGNDEIAQLCLNINFMSNELKRKLDHERVIEKAKNELISGVSHDLRTPLTSIKGYLQLLKDKEYQKQEQLEEYIDIAYSKTEMLENLIESLFEYTKLSGQEIKLEYQRLCLNDIVKQVSMDYAPLFQREKLNLQLSIPHEKYYVQIDPEKFVRVIENLLVNALKYSLKPGEVWVSLKPDSTGVKMIIQNKGQKIEAENLSRLFDRFYRLEQSRSQETGGTGLGLAIAKSIVQLHKGKIWAESRNENIYFNVWLPLDH